MKFVLRTLGLVVGGLLLAAGLLQAPVGAQQTIDPGTLITDQKATWGLSDFGTSRSVADFSSLGWALEENSGNVLVGGNFLNVTNGAQTQSQPYFAAFDVITGTWDSTITPAVGGPILALQNAPDGNVFVGGEMDTWNGTQIGALAKIDPTTGDLISTFPTRLFGGTSVVRDLNLAPDGWLYVGGSFTTANDGGAPIAVDDVVRVDPNTGLLDRTWIPDTSRFEGIWGVAASHVNDNVYIAGKSIDLGQGQSTDPNVNKGLKVVSKNDASLVTWNGFQVNKTATQMYDVETTPWGTVFIGGTEHGLYIHDENNNMALINNHVTNRNTDIQGQGTVRSGGDYQDIELVGDTVFATCHCWGGHSSKTTLIDYTPSWDLANIDATHTGLVSGVIAYDAQTGSHDTSFEPWMAGDVGGWGTLATSNGCLWVTGGFNAVGLPGAQVPGRDFVKFCGADGGIPAVGAPASCTATIEDGSVEVTWTAGANAEDYVVRRSANGGAIFWRGASSSLSFTDTDNGADLTYYVESRLAGTLSSATECTTTVVVPQLDAPASCTATIENGTVTVAWPAGAGAQDYIVSRSVNGGTIFWRGVTANLTFSDSDRDGDLLYYVASRADGVVTDQTLCTTDVIDPPPPTLEPVANCTFAPNGADINVTWSAAAGADKYVIYRTVNGSSQFWRGAVSNGLSFVDSNRTGTLEYFVESVAADGTRSTRTQCSEGAGPPPAGPEAVASCSVSVAGGTVTVTWPAVADPASEFVIRRSVNASPQYWRGKVSTTSFTDTDTSGTVEYFVETKLNNEFSERVACTPII